MTETPRLRLDIAVHQLATSYLHAPMGPSDEDPRPGEVDPQDAIGGVLWKVLDGTDWMARYDTHSRAINGLAGVTAHAEEHHRAGRGFIPWANVTGVDPVEEGRLAALAAIAAQASSNPAIFIANVEPYPQFWPHRGDVTRGKAWAYVQSFFANGGDDLWFWLDARTWQLSNNRGIGFAHWLTAMNHYGNKGAAQVTVLPEMYWTDQLRTMMSSLSQGFDALNRYGIRLDHIAPTFPGDSTPGDMVAAIRNVHARGTMRPNIWQRLSLRNDTAIAIASMPDLWASEPEPEINLVFSEEMVDDLIAKAFRRGWGQGSRAVSSTAESAFSVALSGYKSIQLPPSPTPPTIEQLS